MLHHDLDIPEAHGEVVTRPPLDTWASLARSNARVAAGWRFKVGGRDVTEVRDETRAALARYAQEYTASLGLVSTASHSHHDLIVVTGHQPELFHPGVWAKYFMLQRLIAETGATGLDIVLDSDAFSGLSVVAPCLVPEATRCRLHLSADRGERCYAGVPVPSSAETETFCRAGANALGSLANPSIKRHFDRFCDLLSQAAEHASDLPGLVTGARRRYEGELTGYLELPVTGIARTRPYLLFSSDVILGAARFAECYNAELTAHREAHGVRSSTRPFPDLETGPDGTEIPFWLLADGRRERAFVREAEGGIRLASATGRLTLPAEPSAMADALMASGAVLAPRAVTLTLFARMLLADLFIHGMGGARYDAVTEGVASRYWGVSLPPFAAGSLTMRLPLEVPAAGAEGVAALDKTLERLAHNPDEFIGVVEFADAEQASRAASLAAEKRDLVSEIGTEGADKKTLGARIREVNTALKELLGPAEAEIESKRAVLAAQAAEAEVLTDRTYPFCLWDPAEIAERVR